MPRALPITAIRLDGETQGREAVNWELVEEYALAMAEGATFPPVVTFYDGADYWLGDGFHRVYASEKAGRAEVSSDIRQGDQRAAKLHAAGANINHGARRTNADKRRVVLMLLRDEEWGKWSDGEIAKRCGVSQPFVSKVRAHLVEQSHNRYDFAPLTNTSDNQDDETAGAVAPRPSLYDFEPPRYDHATLTPGPAPDALPQQAPAPGLMSSASHEWYTPAPYLEAVREVLGAIDLDPASCPAANDRVGAARYFTAGDDGLTREWAGRVFLNPPYGREEGESNQKRWAHRLVDQYRRGITTEAVLLVNATPSNQWWAPLWDFPVCFTDHRIRFWGPAVVDSAPTHSNAFIYLGRNEDAFDRIFSRFGVVVVRRTRGNGTGA